MKQVNAYLLILPALLLVGLFAYYPIIQTFIDSFFSNDTIFIKRHFIGVENYKTLFNDPIFLKVLHNTIYYVLVSVPLSIFLALIMALAVNKKSRQSSFLRISFFTPTMLPMVAIANIWLFIYAPEIGLLNKILEYFGFSGVNWLGDVDVVLDSLIVITVWKEAGLFMIFYLAALQSLPEDLLEASRVEGANSWQTFWKISFPLLMPTTFFIFVNSVINSFKMVDHLFILTKGGPDNASNLLLYYIYEVAFSYLDYSYAATLTIVLLLILVAITIVKFIFIEKRIHYR